MQTDPEKLFPICSIKAEVGPFSKVTSPAGTSVYYQAQNNLTFDSPLTMDFEIRREFLGSAQTGTFKIYNLSDASRNAIYHDQYATSYLAALQFRAGYQTQYQPLIFNGQIRWAYSELPDKDWITTIQAYDGGAASANSISAFSLGPGATIDQVINRLNQDLVGIYPSPIIGTMPPVGKNLRPRVFCGPTLKLMQAYLPQGVRWTIDNNQLKVLGNADAIQVGQGAFVVSAETGLLRPPVRAGASIEVEMLFEPRITVGQLVSLQSDLIPQFNGTYMVNGLTHQGRISPDVDSEIKTRLTLWLGTEALNTITGSSPQ